MSPDRTYIDVHVLQSVPPSCVNRDDTGSPKSAQYGGVRRARVSSQAWKRATRSRFADILDQQDLGVRTKRVVDLVVEQLLGLRTDLDEDTATSLAEAAVTAAGIKLEKSRDESRQESKYLILISRQQARTLAQLALDALDQADDVALALKAVTAERKRAKQALQGGNSIDLALFGRMVADDADLNVDASCQVAHALSVHAAANEFDYFTAVDDLKPETAEGEAADAGAGMIGTVEFTSATLYRYSSINVHELRHSLGDEAMTRRGIEAFIRAFVLSMPTGKVNTFANHTLPESVVVTVRHDHPVSWVGAFEKPVAPDASGGYGTAATAAMVQWARSLEDAYSAPTAAWSMGVGELSEALSTIGEPLPFADLPSVVAAAVTADPSGDA